MSVSKVRDSLTLLYLTSSHLFVVVSRVAGGDVTTQSWLERVIINGLSSQPKLVQVVATGMYVVRPAGGGLTLISCICRTLLELG